MEDDIEIKSEPVQTRLYIAAKKLAGISYLMECEANTDLLPKDQHDAKWGLALILQDLESEISDMATELESREVKTFSQENLNSSIFPRPRRSPRF